MKIAILLISTEKYNTFVKPCVDSIRNYLNKQDEIDIFLFSDQPVEGLINYKIEHKSWPYITLERFKTFIPAYDRLADYDFVLYMDVDLECVEPINLDLSKVKLLAVNHPGNLVIKDHWPVETNKQSAAYLDPKDIGVYIQGCLWGMSKAYFQTLNSLLAEYVDYDIKNGIVAIWHDESHLNKLYFHNQGLVTLLNSSYAYPENWNLSIPKLIVHKDKNMVDYPRFERV